MDPVSSALVSFAKGTAFTALKRVLADEGSTFAEIRQRHGQEAAFEVELELQKRLAKLEGRLGELEKLRATMPEAEAAALISRLATEAAYATTRERMRMLAAALAGLFTPELDSEMRSRVSRAVLQLEPSDVLALKRMNDPTSPELMSDVWRDLKPRAIKDALEGAGCVATSSLVGQPPVMTTPVGLAVLQALEDWKP